VIINKIQFRNDIQLLRAIAVVAVIFFHYNKNLFPNGYLGVDVFFVISGFLISNIIYSNKSLGNFNLLNFFKNRVKRIFPALLSVILFSEVLAYITLNNEEINAFNENSFWSIIFLSNFFLARQNSYFSNDSELNLLVNLWSLSIEEQFYILLPFLIVLIFNKSKKFQYFIYTFLIILSMLSMTKYFYNSYSVFGFVFNSFNNYLFYSPITRFWEFLLGTLTMLLSNSNTRHQSNKVSYILWTFLILILFSTFQFFETIILMIIVNFTVATLLFFNVETEKFSSNFIIKFLLKIGTISYSLYLFHQPILAAIKNHNENSQNISNLFINLNNLVVALLIFITIFITSNINFYFIENFFRKEEIFKKYFKKYLISSISLIILFLITSNITNNFEYRFEKFSIPPNSKLEFKSGTNFLLQDKKLCIDRAEVSTLCDYGDGDNNLYLIGDSILSSITSGFVESENYKGFKIIEFTKQGCPLLYGKCEFFDGSKRYSEIMSINNSFIILGGDYGKYFLNNKYEIIDNKLIVNSNLDKLKFVETVENLKFTVELLEKQNNKVYIINSFPRSYIDLKMFNHINGFDLILERSNKTLENEIYIYNFLINKFETKHIIDLSDMFCENSICNYFDRDNYFFNDYIHLSYFGAKLISDQIYEFIK